MLKLYRNFLMGSVLALGLAACGDDLTIVEPPAPPVNPNIVSFSVNPTNIVMAAGTFVQAGANLVTAAGVTGSVAWSTSNAAVADVDATGKVTANSNGSAVITATATAGGQTATAQIGVTVRQIIAASVSIKSVTTGLTTLPVNISNVMGQIEITLNFEPGEQLVDSVAVYIGAKRAAKQVFSNTGAAREIVLSVNTANYTKNTTTGVATVDYLNGATTISAAVFPQGATGTATNTIQIVLNNSDGWAADMSAPTAVANSSIGLTYWGGPTAGGISTVTAYPVIYTPGRTVANVMFGVAGGFGGGCVTPVADVALPFRATFGYAAAGATVDCSAAGAAFEHTGAPGSIRDNVIVVNAIDNTNNPYPLTPLIPNTVVLGSTPDSLRFDWLSPSVGTPSIARTAPAVTGWVNGPFSFINFASADAGVGLRTVRDRAVSYTKPNCGGGAATAMPSGTGADIPECSTNSIGGTPGLGGTAPYRVSGTESDRLANVGTSSNTPWFGVDKTIPSIRWGIPDATIAAYTLPAGRVVNVDTVYRASKPVPANDEYRIEYLDQNPVTNVTSGFFNAGAPLGGVAAQTHALSTAGHINNAGLCVVGTGPIGPTFVTAPACGLAFITAGGFLRLDGWQGGQSVPLPLAEAYYGYTSTVTDAAGNTAAPLFRKSLVNTVSPFASLIGIPGTLTSAAFSFSPTFADSAEVVAQSLQLEFPNFAALVGAETDSLRYTRTAIGTAFDDVITSPFSGFISPPNSAPFVRRVERVTAAVFPAYNIPVAPVTVKPTTVVAWSWNHGSTLAGGPLPGRTAITAIPGLFVQDGVNMNNFNFGADGVAGGAGANADNVTNPVNHWRIISSVATTNFFGSTVPLRAQAASPTNTPNPPFVRVDFYRWDGVSHWDYLGSDTSALPSDQGTYRSWVWDLANASFVARWNGTAQGGTVSTNVMAAVGVTAAGDGIVAGATMVP